MWGKQDQPKYISYKIVGRGEKLKVAFYDGEVWLTQKQLAEIFNVKIATVNEHLKKIFSSGKFPKTEYSRQFAIEAPDGKLYQVNHYRAEIMEEIEKKTRSFKENF